MSFIETIATFGDPNGEIDRAPHMCPLNYHPRLSWAKKVMFISRAHASERAPTSGPAGAEAKTKPGTYGRGQDALQGGVTKEGNQRTGPRPGRIIAPSRSTAEETPAAAFAGAKGAKKIKRDKGGPSHEKCLSGTS